MIKRTYNTKLIRELLSDKRLNDRVTHDGEVKTFDPENQKHLYYLEVIEGDCTLGFYIAHMMNSPICLQLHANFLSKYWGKGLSKHAKEVVKWLFENTEAKKIVAFCPTIYPEVKGHAEKGGMIEEGLLTNSSFYNGKLCDNYIMGISKC